jgi:transposase
VRPRDLAGKARRRLAAEQLAELVVVEKSQDPHQRAKAMVLARRSTLMDLAGVGPVVAARILSDVGDVARFSDRNRFASSTGTAPLGTSSGSRSGTGCPGRGNRKMNHILHIAAATQGPARDPRPGPLPAQVRRRQDPDGDPAVLEAKDLRRRLPPASRRRPSHADRVH